VIEELNREHFNISHGLELADTDMVTSSNVQKHTVNEKQESLDVQVLAPRKAQVKEEF
jgi:hypothetical protein